MAAPDFTMKRGDTLPKLRATLQDSAGDPVDLSSFTSFAWFYQDEDQEAAALTGAGSFSVIDATNGIVEYSWDATDTDTVGRYVGEIEGKIGAARQTFPNGGFLLFDIVPDLDDA
jgi:hypothetical protein